MMRLKPCQVYSLVSKISARLKIGRKLLTSSTAALRGLECNSIAPPHSSSHSLLR